MKTQDLIGWTVRLQRSRTSIGTVAEVLVGCTTHQDGGAVKDGEGELYEGPIVS